jgi:hypothetical protein
MGDPAANGRIRRLWQLQELAHARISTAPTVEEGLACERLRAAASQRFDALTRSWITPLSDAPAY